MFEQEISSFTNLVSCKISMPLTQFEETIRKQKKEGKVYRCERVSLSLRYPVHCVPFLVVEVLLIPLSKECACTIEGLEDFLFGVVNKGVLHQGSRIRQ